MTRDDEYLSQYAANIVFSARVDQFRSDTVMIGSPEKIHRMNLQTIALLLALLSISAPAAAQDVPSPSALDCKTGPVSKTYGDSLWLVYACNDGHSVTLISAPDSKAAPFVFIFHWADGQYQLSGAGTGNKEATDAAFADLRGLTEPDVEKLLGDANAQPMKSN